MTDLPKFMFNCTRDISMLGANMLGAKKLIDAFNAAAQMAQTTQTSPGDSCCTISPAPTFSAMPTISLMDALYPVTWLKLASGLLEVIGGIESAGSRRGRALVSVLDRMPGAMDSPPAQKSLPAATPSAPSTGWGPMP
jgi:hypothetical protein